MSNFELTALERAVSVFSPSRARAMAQTRFGVMVAGQYAGARRDKTSLKNFNPAAGSADSDSLGDLLTLRSRSRDLARNNPIARGARNTAKTNIPGAGLRLSAELQRELLGLSDDEAETWEDNAEILFHLWASSKFADVTRKQTFYEMQGLAFTSAWDSGDCFALRRYKESTSFIALCVQMIEADRVCTPNNYVEGVSGPEIRDGVELDGDGEEVAYHLLNQHPGDEVLLRNYKPEDWARIAARGEYNQLLMIHLMEMDRIGQTRGVPMLAPIIEALKQLDRYAEAELMAAVVSAFFTVFIKSQDEAGGSSGIVSETMSGSGPMGGDGVPSYDARNQVEMGSGTVAELGPGEDIQIANPNRPNPNFDPFFLAVIRQIGIALGIPYEVLIMHFSSSYTASKAAIETARQFFTDRRVWLARNFCQPVYEWFLYECVLRGIIKAPGFLEDPVKRAAWCGSKWIGRAPIVLDAVKDANAAEMWIDLGVKTVESVTIETNPDGDWWRNQEQRKREIALRKGITPAIPQPEKTATEPGGDSGGQ